MHIYKCRLFVDDIHRDDIHRILQEKSCTKEKKGECRETKENCFYWSR